MALEIERKFLVKSHEYREEALSKEKIVQAFLNTHPKRTVRIRIKEVKAFLTVKGKSNHKGTSRFEWETEIPVEDAKNLLDLCEDGMLEKTRYEVRSKNHIFEVDEFFGDNMGLVVAEVELQTEEETFTKPQWLGKEVTGDPKYYNSQLSKRPYKYWKDLPS